MKYTGLFTLFLTAFFWGTNPLQAAVLTTTFEGSGSPFDFDANTGTYIIQGSIEMVFQSYVSGSPGDAGDELNAGATGFGINESGGGDETQQLDGDNGNEGILITFNYLPVNAHRILTFDLTSIGIGLFSSGSGDTGEWSHNGGTPSSLSNLDNAVGPISISDGDTLFIEYTAGASGNGFSLDYLTFNANIAPEPSTAVLLGCGLFALRGYRNKQQRG